MLLKNEFSFQKKSKIKAGEGKKEGRYPFFTSSDTKVLYIDDFLFDNEAVILGTGGMPSCNYYNGKFAVSTDNFVLTSKGNILTKVLYYFLRNNNLSILAEGFHGAGLKHIGKDYIENIDIPFISKQNQIKLVTELDGISELIKNADFQIQKLDELVKSRFIEMFGNCDNKIRLEELSALITKGSSPKWQGIDYVDDGVLFVTSENVREGFIDISNPKYLEEKVNIKQPRSILKRGDVLINIVGASIGSAASYDYDFLANINQAVSLVRPNDKINIIYLITFLNTENAMMQYKNNAKGGARDNLSLKNISDLIIPFPDAKEQNEFADFVRLIDKSKFILHKQKKNLEELYESKLHEYFGDW